MNQYWEKYRNKNRSQDIQPTIQEMRVPSETILDHISSMQNHLNSLENRMIDINCKLSTLSAYEGQFIQKNQIILEKIDRFEHYLENKTGLEQRLNKIEENADFFKYESLRKEISLMENRLSECFSSEIGQINRKVQEINERNRENRRSRVKFEDEQDFPKDPKENLDKWQRKIEKVLEICVEKIKNTEDLTKRRENNGNITGAIEDLGASIGKFKKFQTKITKKVEELEDFSKKLCKKVMSLESGDKFSCSPLNKNLKDQQFSGTQGKSRKFTSDSYTKTLKSIKPEQLDFTKPKKPKSRSISPTEVKNKGKSHNKLDKLYQELNF